MVTVLLRGLAGGALHCSRISNEQGTLLRAQIDEGHEAVSGEIFFQCGPCWF